MNFTLISYLTIYNHNVIGIIVPTKSLIWQTYRDVMRQKFNKYKVIFHDQMYNKQEKLICVFTQERALRFLRENKGLYFDKLYIDEAHKLFNKDDRSILLARLIRINGALNKEQQVLYLSPLIKESKNLMIDGVMIQEQK